VSYKPKHNSLRCKIWDIFAKRKLAWLKEIGLAVKAYMINGYKIILKADTNLAIIEAPPGIAIFHNKRSSYVSGTYDPEVHADPVEVYYCDMFGYTNELPVKVAPLQGNYESYPSRYDGSGWRGQLALFPGGRDAIVMLAGLHPAKSEIWTSRFSSLLVGGLQVAVPGKIIELLGRLLVEPGTQNSAISCAITVQVDGTAYTYFTYVYDRAGNYFGDSTQLVASISLTPLPSTLGAFNTLDYAQIPIPPHVPAYPSTYWSSLHPVCVCSWVQNGKLRILWGLEGSQYVAGEIIPLPLDNAVFLFTDTELVDPTDVDTYIVTHVGLTTTQAIHDIDHTVFDIGSGDYQFGLSGMSVMAFAPAQLCWDLAQCKNVVFPRPDGTAVLFHYDQWDEFLTPNPLVIRLALDDSPVYETDYSIPYTGARNAFPMSTVVDLALDLHLYWEEVMYGDEATATEYTNVENLQYGSPLNGVWTALISLPAGIELITFQVIEFTADSKIILGVAFKPGDDGGTCVVLYDSSRNELEWSVGRPFTPERLERASATVFGDHPYVEKRKRYAGTSYAWSFFHTRPGYFGT
jgi:hypothetical protein